MPPIALRIVLACGLLIVPYVALASVVINEVLFDPAGTDTGLELIELYNPDAVSLDLSGWELYPDGVGYVSFPAGFSLTPRTFVVIHLRVSSANDPTNLYHPAATANMGNSSGSIALFRSGGRSSDTLVDFVRYHRAGSAERKTWESTAVETELWTAGDFVDVSRLAEGNSIGRAEDGLRGGASSWRLYASPSLGRTNAGGISAPAPASSSAATSTEIMPVASAPPPTPSLGADAGQDATVLAGTIVQFRGIAHGLNGEVLENARFLWNFGDGSTQEGKSLTHIYRFPGTYHANLAVQSGHYAGSDWRTIIVLPPAVAVSEVKPEMSGFIELFNASSQSADLGGLLLIDDRKIVFRIPLATLVGAKSALVLPNIATGLDPLVSLELRDAPGATLDLAKFSGALPVGASWQRTANGFAAAPRPTPGAFDATMPLIPTPDHAAAPLTLGREAARVPPQQTDGPPPAAASGAPASSPISGLERTTAAGSAAGAFNLTPSPSSFFTASILIGLLIAAGMVWVKRRAP
jgi:PKD repeat protein